MKILVYISLENHLQYYKELHFPENYKALYPKDYAWNTSIDKADEVVVVYIVTDDGNIGFIQFQYASSLYV